MTIRTTLPSSGSHTGSEFLDNVVQHVNRFWNISTIPLTSVAGTGDVVTATIDPITNVGLVAGMSFTFKAGANNTGAVTLKIGAEAAKPIVTAANVALVSGAILSGTTYTLNYDGTSYRVLSVPGENLQGAVFVINTFTASGTLTKPVNFPADGLVFIESWGGGGGGKNGSGGAGGGGGYSTKEYRGADLGTTETVTIGAGGALETGGGNTTVGTLCDAFGGAGTNGSLGGGGGGQISAGSGQIGGDPSPGSNTGAGGGAGGDGIHGGGGGGGSGNDGGHSLYGGAGGGGNGNNGGTSAFSGNGGASGVGGVIPSGGGGSNATGARGQVRVRWIS